MRNSKNAEKMILKIAESLYENLSCVIYIDNKYGRYTTIKADEYWDNCIGTEGEQSKLFYQLFTKTNNENTAENTKYNRFIDTDFFKKEKYNGNIEVWNDGNKKTYAIYLVKLSETEAALMLRLAEGVDEVNQRELDKIDAIQENYLFSMMVNLADDLCLNPNTTEISATRQDYLDFKYSEWRLMILNMFKDSDRATFLHMSSPEYIINTLEEQHSYDLELQMLNVQGQYIWSKLTFSRMKNFSRTNPRFVYTVKDYQKEMNRLLSQENIVKAIEAQNKELIELDKERTKFFSNMSHEIRTPLNAILGMNEVILQEAKEERIRKYARDVKNSGKFLKSIVNDILDYSKIKAGKMQIVPMEYSLKDMIKDINKMAEAYIGEKELKYEVRISSDLPDYLYGDEVRVKQIIINLLTNAIKYTPEGKVLFEVRPAKTENGHFALDVRVSDTGIGIKKSQLNKLFGEYERIDEEKNHKIEGTGLGMGIVTSLLAQMESKLSVESVYGKGSTFSFVLPQKVVNTSEIKENINLHMDWSDKKVLVVDDNAINLYVAINILRKYNIKADTADSGKKCLEVLENNEYDLVMLDHLMPVMDGEETLRKIREKHKMPVIAMTANIYPDARSEYMKMGFTDYVEKPIVSEQIEMVLRNYLV